MVRVQVDRRAKNSDVTLRIDLHPARTSRRNEGLNARRRARKTVRDDLPELADIGIEGEAEGGFRVVVKYTENGPSVAAPIPRLPPRRFRINSVSLPSARDAKLSSANTRGARP